MSYIGGRRRRGKRVVAEAKDPRVRLSAVGVESRTLLDPCRRSRGGEPPAPMSAPRARKSHGSSPWSRASGPRRTRGEPPTLGPHDVRRRMSWPLVRGATSRRGEVVPPRERSCLLLRFARRVCSRTGKKEVCDALGSQKTGATSDESNREFDHCQVETVGAAG